MSSGIFGKSFSLIPQRVSKGNVNRLYSLARPHSRIIASAIGLLFVSSCVTMSVPFSMGTIIDIVLQKFNGSKTVQEQETKETRTNLSMTSLFSLLVGIFFIGAGANAGRVYLFKCAGERIIASLRNQLYKKFIKQDIAFHDQNISGELISRLSTDSVVVGKAVTSNISDGLRSSIMAMTGVGAMCYVNLKLTLIMMTIVPPVALSAVFYGRLVRDVSRKTNDATAELTKFSEEKLSNIRTVRAFAQEEREIVAYENRIQTVYRLAMKEGFASAVFFGSAGLAGNLTILAILYYGGSMVQAGEISIGELTSFFLYTGYVGSSMIGLSSWYSELMKGLGASTRLFTLLDHSSHIESQQKNQKLERIQGTIEFKNVSFSYPTRLNSPIFKDLSFTVESGQTIAIVGASGTGKSTIAQLLLRFYDPLKGQILIDGKDIKDLELNWMREHVFGLVPQEPVLFSSSIKENIAYSKPTAQDSDVIGAAMLSNAHQFIESFPEQYNTLAGHRGLALSGGQKQRIAIARAILKNPKILLLDEATSALDASSEFLVQEALQNLIQGRTVITIAHRLSTIQQADKIVMIDAGIVAETGTFDELMMIENGKFKAMVEKQMLDSQA